MTDGHTIDAGDTQATMRGVLRLESQDAYTRLFAPVRAKLAAAASYTIDVSDVVLMNSSGIRALGTLVLDARKTGVRLTLRGKRDVPWQKKTMSSLAPLYPAGISVELT